MSGQPIKLPKVRQVQNKAPAKHQITAEQILREAKERIQEDPPPPKQLISDPDELKEYQRTKRKGYEDALRRNRSVIGNWLKYARFEEEQDEFSRARSVYERALDQGHRSHVVWLRYAEMEMKHKNVNHARNIYDRAVSILPRVDQFWYKYVYMEELLGNVAGTRKVFERWMEWEPEEQAWNSYIKMELRYHEVDRARAIYERYILVHPKTSVWVKYAIFEFREQRDQSRARNIYERASEYFGDEFCDEFFYKNYAKFEEICHNNDRCLAIYKYGIEKLGKEKTLTLNKEYMDFQKKYGDLSSVEGVTIDKKRIAYEKEVKENPKNYDVWFDYIKLEESNNDVGMVREVYKRAVSNIPPQEVKKYWKRYIYLWIYYCLYEELVTKDVEKCRSVYQNMIDIIPHSKFTFAKCWIMYSKFEIRQKQLARARKILGKAIRICPKNKLFTGYIDLETQLRCFDRCRILYSKFLEYDSTNSTTWISYAKLEAALGDYDRAKGVYDIAINQSSLEMPELLWYAYINYEKELDNSTNVRELYQKLLQRTKNVKVYISFAKFEVSLIEEEREVAMNRARAIFKKAEEQLKTMKTERVLLLEAWLEIESQNGSEQSVLDLKKKMPKKVKKRRFIDENDESLGMEEYYDYVFPEDQKGAPNLKLLEMAHAWKKKQQQQQAKSDIV